jgi:hypothetical protein
MEIKNISIDDFWMDFKLQVLYDGIHGIENGGKREIMGNGFR